VSLIELAAWGCVLGAGGLDLLTCADSFDLDVRQRIIARAFELDQWRLRQLAVLIANAIVQSHAG